MTQLQIMSYKWKSTGLVGRLFRRAIVFLIKKEEKEEEEEEGKEKEKEEEEQTHLALAFCPSAFAFFLIAM